jgi:hypothetical protein
MKRIMALYLILSSQMNFKPSSAFTINLIIKHDGILEIKGPFSINFNNIGINYVLIKKEIISGSCVFIKLLITVNDNNLIYSICFMVDVLLRNGYKNIGIFDSMNLYFISLCEVIHVNKRRILQIFVEFSGVIFSEDKYLYELMISCKKIAIVP